MKDEFPDMPSKLCRHCGKVKKIMFFTKKRSFCRECDKAQNAARVPGNPAPGYVVLFGDQPLRRS